LACLVGVLISWTLARLDIDRAQANAETQVLARLSQVQANLSTVLRSTFSPTDSLVNLIAIERKISDRLFAAMSERLIRQTPTIRNMVVAPDDRIRMVHPLAGNEAVMGFRYADRPEQYAVIQKARALRQPVLSGPVNLIQGGKGFIQRYPVFTSSPGSDEEGYWGVVSIVADFEKVLAAGGVYAATELNLAIVALDSPAASFSTVFGDPLTGGMRPVSLRMNVPGAVWELRAAPQKGWPSLSVWTSGYWLFGLVNSIFLGVLCWQLLLRQGMLRQHNQALSGAIAAKHESQRLLYAIVDNAPALIYVFDTEGRLLLCNQLFEKAVGRRREQIIGQPRSTFLPEAVANEHIRNDQQVLTQHQPLSTEESNQEGDGLHTYLTVKSPLYNGQEEVIAVVGISTDITARKRAESDLLLASAVYENTADGIVITDQQGKIVSINRAFTEITGYCADEAIGANPNILHSDRQEPDFYQSMWAMLHSAGVWQGEIWNRRKNGELYPEWLTITTIKNPAQEITNYVGVFSDISAIKHTQSELEHLAHFDPLTDLPNRVLFHDRLSHALERATRYRHKVALLLLDLDGFKTVNDSLGHPIGDRLLQMVAERLKTCVRVEDTVSRLGGDEFAIALANLEQGEDVVEVAQKILTTAQHPFDIDGHSALVTTSIGIAIFPEDGDESNVLIRNADAAMYQAKESGRNTYRYYQQEMTQAAQLRLANEQALRRGIAQHEFEVWYQPQVCLTSGRLLGAEALVRWRDPTHGLIAPANFIPLAEMTGLIVPIGEQVLRSVCADARRWLDAGLAPGRLSINVAGPQLYRSDFVGLLQRVLEEFQLPPALLDIEITETFILENPPQIRRILNDIQAMGITTAIDDFGTGYSSLAYLKKLPINTLKIDRAFVSDLPDDSHDVAICRAILGMGRSLGFNVIAEGIETEAQRQFLQDEGCAEGQGYLFSKPLPADEFTAWLRR
jgi:diguanylate cyclase (GGDEF)-like protein/PAS domain S-box-containing protein